MVVGGRRPALHKVQPTQTQGFRSNLTPLHPLLSLLLHLSSGMLAGFFFSFFFLQEMKRSSVQRVSKGLVSPPFSLPRFLCLYMTVGGREEGVGRALTQLLKCGRLR